MSLFNGPALASEATFLGGILHEIWQKLEDPSRHSLEGALADIKSNLIGLVNALKPGDCGKNCECENRKSNP